MDVKHGNWNALPALPADPEDAEHLSKQAMRRTARMTEVVSAAMRMHDVLIATHLSEVQRRGAVHLLTVLVNMVDK